MVAAGMAAQLGAVLLKSRAVRWLVVAGVAGWVCSVVVLAAAPSLLVSQIAANGRAMAQLGAGPTVCLGGSVPASAKYDIEQATNAKTIWSVAHQLRLGDRGAVVGIVTALQESALRNVDHGDRDSVGLFQQRANWGPVAVRMDPWKASGLFFAALRRVAGWESLPVGVAAQRVQVSAFPDRYAQWEPDADALVGAMPAAGPCDQVVGGGPVPAGFDRQGNPRTVEQAIAWIRSAAPGGVPGEPVLGACERYMTLAYGWDGGYGTALAHWDAPGPRMAGGGDMPPRGALVFWRTANPAGHVALSLGGGVVASTDYNPVTHAYEAGTLGMGPIADIDAWGPRLGWRAPNFRVGSER